jgi:hypothetical protein
MAKRKETRANRPGTREDERLRAIYKKSRQEFSAADLQKFTEEEEGVPFQTVLDDLERMHRTTTKKRA